MNQRIRELIKQAGYTQAHYYSDDGPFVPAEFNKEKFAELIVRECCETVERRYKYSNGTPVSFWQMSQDVQDLLKEHFGVEE